jgi:hypothetical protein
LTLRAGTWRNTSNRGCVRRNRKPEQPIRVTLFRRCESSTACSRTFAFDLVSLDGEDLRQILPIVTDRRSHQQFDYYDVIRNGLGQELGFVHLGNQYLDSCIAYLLQRKIAEVRIQLFIETVLPSRYRDIARALNQLSGDGHWPFS